MKKMVFSIIILLISFQFVAGMETPSSVRQSRIPQRKMKFICPCGQSLSSDTPAYLKQHILERHTKRNHQTLHKLEFPCFLSGCNIICKNSDMLIDHLHKDHNSFIKIGNKVKNHEIISQKSGREFARDRVDLSQSQTNRRDGYEKFPLVSQELVKLAQLKERYSSDVRVNSLLLPVHIVDQTQQENLGLQDATSVSVSDIVTVENQNNYVEYNHSFCPCRTTTAKAKEAFLRHLISKHQNGEGIFECPSENCVIHCKNIIKFFEHIQTVHESFYYCCKMMMNKAEYDEHKKTCKIHENTSFCPCGNTTAKLIRGFKHHLKSHQNGEGVFECPAENCVIHCENITEFFEHIQTVHESFYYCCKMMMHRAEYDEHKKTCKIHENTSFCPCGNTTAKLIGGFKHHLKSHQNGEGIFECPAENCVMHCEKNAEFFEHIQTVHESFYYCCKMMMNKAEYDEHKKTCKSLLHAKSRAQSKKSQRHRKRKRIDEQEKEVQENHQQEHSALSTNVQEQTVDDLLDLYFPQDVVDGRGSVDELLEFEAGDQSNAHGVPMDEIAQRVQQNDCDCSDALPSLLSFMHDDSLIDTFEQDSLISEGLSSGRVDLEFEKDALKVIESFCPCGKIKTKHKQKFETHLNKKHKNEQGVFECPARNCARYFAECKGLMGHLQMDHEVFYVCCKILRDKKDYEEHKKTCKIHRFCPCGNTTAKSLRRFKDHIIENHQNDQGKFECPAHNCVRHFVDCDGLLKHLQTDHEAFYSCCKLLMTKVSYEEHKKTCKIHENICYCPCGDTRAKFKGGFAKHLKNKHQNSEGIFECPAYNCVRHFTDCEGLLEHLQKVHESFYYCCGMMMSKSHYEAHCLTCKNKKALSNKRSIIQSKQSQRPRKKKRMDEQEKEAQAQEQQENNVFTNVQELNGDELVEKTHHEQQQNENKELDVAKWSEFEEEDMFGIDMNPEESYLLERVLQLIQDTDDSTDEEDGLNV